VTDPAGGHGWRSARDLPPRAGGPFGFGRIADRAEALEQAPLCVLLLPCPVEDMPDRERIGELLAAPGVAAVEPARFTARRPDVIADGLAALQARRLRLPGFPRAIVLYDERQYRLARALLMLHPDAELWYGGAGGGELHELAAARAAFSFRASDDTRPLFERMERLGVASGRLGSERPDVH
jgi:hypothetical protein